MRKQLCLSCIAKKLVVSPTVLLFKLNFQSCITNCDYSIIDLPIVI